MNRITEGVSALLLGLVGLVVLQQAVQGDLRPRLAAKFLNRGEQPAPAATATGSTGVSINDLVAGTRSFGDPVPGAALISPFGAPRDGGARSHEGIDLGAPEGTPVLASHAGTIAYTSASGLCGLGAAIQSGEVRSVYCHLSRVDVSRGDVVRRGTQIGAVGKTGNASQTPPHLHFEIRKGGVPQNPAPLIGR